MLGIPGGPDSDQDVVTGDKFIYTVAWTTKTKPDRNIGKDGFQDASYQTTQGNDLSEGVTSKVRPTTAPGLCLERVSREGTDVEPGGLLELRRWT